MKILFVTPSYKPAYVYGGPIVTIAMLAEELVQLGHAVTVLTTTANGKQELDVITKKPVLIDGVTVIYFERATGDHTHFSISLWRYLYKHVRAYDAVHIHSWWNVLAVTAAWICKLQGIKPILSPHGMFSQYVLSARNTYKKKVLHQLIGKRLLRYTRLHVSTPMEWTESQAINPGWQGCIIPNLVALPKENYARLNNEVFTIGFLSRIDPKKGLNLLIQALGKVAFPFKLLIAGTGAEGYIQSLQQLAESCGIADKVVWAGWKSGEEKFKFLSQIDLFVLTSHNENFALVVIESLAVGTPVLVSKEVGLHAYVESNKLGWVTSLESADITTQLEAIYSEQQVIETIRAIAPASVRQAYAPVYLAQQYVELYLNNLKNTNL